MRFRIRVRAAAMVYLLTTTAAHAATIAVPAGGDFQAALDAARPGDVITLEPNATYTGNFVLPNKGATSSYITIRSAAPDTVFPAAGVRITPAYASHLPKIKSPNFLPALQPAAGANHYRLIFLEFQANGNGAGDIISIGVGDSTQTELSQVPYAFILDRLYVHGDPELGQKRGIALHSSDTTVVNSWVSDCKAINQESQAIGGFNGPGNWLIENNYLEAASQNFMLGGSDPFIPNLVTTHVVFRHNYLTKRLAWRNPILAAPSNVIATPTAGGGSLPAGTYFYKVVARKLSNQDRIAASSPSSEVSATLNAKGAVTVSWTPVATAQEYLVYGRTSGSESVFWTTTNPFFTDIGDAGTPGKPGRTGTRWWVKNIFELKNAQDVTVEGNVFENNWVAEQPGYAIVLTPRNQNGRAPWVVVQNVRFRNNIVRHTAGGVNILGVDNNAPSQRTNHITIADNIFDDLTASSWGAAKVFLIGDGPDAVTIDHNTIDSTQSSIYYLYGGSVTAPTLIPNLTITNNMSAHNSFGLFGNGISSGSKALAAYSPIAVFRRNVLAGGNAALYPPDNFFPAVADWQREFVGFASGDYHLLSTSRYKRAGTDAEDLGPKNVDVLLAKTALASSGDIRRIESPLRITPTTLPDATFNVPYEQTVSCTGGVASCALQLVDSSLPAGLVFELLDSRSGVIRGTPTTSPGAGSVMLMTFDTAWPFITTTALLPIAVDPPELRISVPAVSAAMVGEPFRLTPTVTGALGSVTWTIASGVLPAGVGLNALTGSMSGIPIAWGTTTALVQAQDFDQLGLNRTASAPVTITVAPRPVQIVTSVLPDGVLRSHYQATLTATGGTGRYAWSVAGGDVPPGLKVDASGLVSGDPLSPGTFSFTVRASDLGWPGNVAVRTFTVVIRALEVVLYASDARVVSGTWSLVADASAAGGFRIWNPDRGAAKLAGALANPVNYFEITFRAEAGVAYHLWVRGKADANFWGNDSVMVQFSGSVDANGAPKYRIGTTSANDVNLENCSGCGISGWGWQDNAWGLTVFGAPIYFEQSGTQTVRVQVKEDGFSIDQILLSADKYISVAPGALKNDTTIVAR